MRAPSSPSFPTHGPYSAWFLSNQPHMESNPWQNNSFYGH